MRQPLTEEQEREVKQLAQAIAEAASQEFEQLARTLVGSGDAQFQPMYVLIETFETAAREFLQYLSSPEARAGLSKAGYSAPQ